MVFSFLYITAIMRICIFNIVKVKKTTTDYEKIMTNNPMISVLYNLLNRFKHDCLYYNSVFILRRVIASLFYVTLKDYQVFQMHI